MTEKELTQGQTEVLLAIHRDYQTFEEQRRRTEGRIEENKKAEKKLKNQGVFEYQNPSDDPLGFY